MIKQALVVHPARTDTLWSALTSHRRVSSIVRLAKKHKWRYTTTPKFDPVKWHKRPWWIFAIKKIYELDGKTAIITGGAAGIGWAIDAFGGVDVMVNNISISKRVTLVCASLQIAM